jgi:hypothetical protein
MIRRIQGVALLIALYLAAYMLGFFVLGGTP